MSAFWHMSRLMDRIMDEYIKEMKRTSNLPIQHDPAVLKNADDAHQVVDDDKKFAVSLDVSQFKPEELKVNLDGRMLTVEGKQECKGENSFMSRSFFRSWLLPEDVVLEDLKTELTDKGRLIIEAPKNPNSGSSKKNISIKSQQCPCSQSESIRSESHSKRGERRSTHSQSRRSRSPSSSKRSKRSKRSTGSRSRSKSSHSRSRSRR